MFSALTGALTRIIPVPLLDRSSTSPSLAPGILDLIIDCCADWSGDWHQSRMREQTLLALGLVSRQTLTRSRMHLFSTIIFSDSSCDERFDKFLSLLHLQNDSGWSSLTNAVQDIHLIGLFDRPSWFNGPPGPQHPIQTLADPSINLVPRLISLKSIKFNRIRWKYVPVQLRYLLSNHPGLETVHLDKIFLWEDDIAQEFISQIPWPVPNIVLFNAFHPSKMTVTNSSLDALRRESLSSSQSLRFKAIDSISLCALRNFTTHILDVEKPLAIDSLHISLVNRECHADNIASVSKAIAHAAASINHIHIEFFSLIPAHSRDIGVFVYHASRMGF
jgi:hypothetical protein